MNTRNLYTEQAFNEWHKERELKEQAIDSCKKNKQKLHRDRLEAKTQLKELEKGAILALTTERELLNAHIQATLLPDEIAVLKNDIIADDMLAVGVRNQHKKNADLQLHIKMAMFELKEKIDLKDTQASIEVLRRKLVALTQKISVTHTDMTNVSHRIDSVSQTIKSKNARLLYLCGQEMAERALYETERAERLSAIRSRSSHHHMTIPLIKEYEADYVLSSEIGHLRDEIKQLSDQQAGLYKRLHHLQSEYDDYKKEHVTEQDAFSKLEKALRLRYKKNYNDVKQEALSDLQAQHDALSIKLQPLDLEQNSLVTKLTELRKARTQKNKALTLLEEQLKQAQLKTAKEPQHLSLDELQDKMRQLNQRHQTLQLSKHALIEKMNQIDSEDVETGVAERAVRKSQSESSSNNFFKTFWLQPQLLITELKKAVIANLQAYDEDHAVGQSLEVRRCLAVYQEQIEATLNFSSNIQTVEMWRERYLQLSGMVYSMIASLKAESADTQLVEVLEAAFGENSFTAEFVLPYFNRLPFTALSDEDLFARESQQLAQAKMHFSRTLSDLTQPHHQDLVSKGQQLIATIDEKLATESEVMLGEIDKPFYIHTLKRATDLALKPDNSVAQHQFKKLIDQNKVGNGSFGKKVIGCLLGFLGAAIVAGALACKILTLGVATPFIVMGTVAGCGLIGTGFGLFNLGRQKPLAKVNHSFFKVAKKIHTDESLPSFAEGTRQLPDEQESVAYRRIPSL